MGITKKQVHFLLLVFNDFVRFHEVHMHSRCAGVYCQEESADHLVASICIQGKYPTYI